MKSAVRLLTAAWLALGSWALGRWWYANPDLFPRVPRSVWQGLDRLIGANNVDQESDVEFVVVVALAFAAVSVTTWLLYLGWRHFARGHKPPIRS